MKNKHRGELLLLLTSFIWGFAFIAQKLGSDYIEPFTFNFFRNLTAGIFLLAYSFFRKNKSRKKVDSITKTATTNIAIERYSLLKNAIAPSEM